MIVNIVERGEHLVIWALKQYDECHPCWHDGDLVGCVYLRDDGGRSLFVPAEEASLGRIARAHENGHDVLVSDRSELVGRVDILTIRGRQARAIFLLKEALNL